MIVVMSQKASMCGRLFRDIESAYLFAQQHAQVLNLELENLDTIRNEIADRHNYAYENFYCISSPYEHFSQNSSSQSIQITLLNSPS